MKGLHAADTLANTAAIAIVTGSKSVDSLLIGRCPITMTTA